MQTLWSQNKETNFLVTSMEQLVSWGRKYSMWPYPFGTACCAIEFMAVTAGDYDLARFGAELVRFSPRQADMLLVLGTVTCKQAPILKRIYEQMAEPKWVVAVGVCASSGGFYQNYHTLQGIDGIIPVDVYVPGCPPRPEAILNAVVELQNKVQKEGFRRDRGEAGGTLLGIKESESKAHLPVLLAKQEAERKMRDRETEKKHDGTPDKSEVSA
ncbi:MAG: NADH-quinone oxidoreductase subunit NuoB [Myxococcales bacterium]|nr:NADH-quinone oxidoreductase subunit NuoB [Myxococcales bacterium]